jgi:hypothetical protein
MRAETIIVRFSLFFFMECVRIFGNFPRFPFSSISAECDETIWLMS